MIVKKPYAFLIKNFRKIHIFLLILCSYVYYKTMQVHSLVKDFLEFSTYDVYNSPISDYIGFLLYFATILIIGISVIVLILLLHKKKPWKAYILPIMNYSVLLIAFLLTFNFFNTYTGGLDTTTARLLRDILFITTIPQYVFFLVLFIRTLGLDLKKFSFKNDAEFLELEEADREEIEININIDKESIKRTTKRLIRNVNYLYLEHKMIFHVIFIILLVIVVNKSYNFIFVTNKAYKEGEVLNNGGYDIVVNNSYYTDKDNKGNVISDDYVFVVVDVTIKNNFNKRKINFNRFHIMNGIENYSPTSKVYATYFEDFGVAYDDKTIAKDEEFNTLLIYRVSKKLNKNKFVLYYQEFGSDNTSRLRKIKVKVNDVSNIIENDIKQLTDSVSLNIRGVEDEISFDNAEFKNQIIYSKQTCTQSGCVINKNSFVAENGYNILELEYSSEEMEGKDMIDFLAKYGKIIYIDNNGQTKDMKIENALGKSYVGKYAYIKVPQDVLNSQTIELTFTVRNNKYSYKIK